MESEPFLLIGNDKFTALPKPKIMYSSESFDVIYSDEKNPEDIQYPPNVEKVNFRHYSTFGGLDKVITFPDTILELKLHINYGLENIILPKSLIRLSFGQYFNADIRNVKFPETLKYLSFGAEFNQDIRNANFPSLTHLALGFYFNQDITNANFPQSLTQLTLRPRYSKDLKNADFPKSLIFLEKGGTIFSKL